MKSTYERKVNLAEDINAFDCSFDHPKNNAMKTVLELPLRYSARMVICICIIYSVYVKPYLTKSINSSKKKLDILDSEEILDWYYQDKT